MTIAVALKNIVPGISPEIFGNADFRAIAEIVYAAAGIVLPDGKAMLVYSRLAPLVREDGRGKFGLYVERIRRDPVEQARAVAALTTNHTFFYREAHHFEHFEREVRPSLVKGLKARHCVRLWSAGCSSGEEPWSLALTMLGRDQAIGQHLVSLDLRLLATDIAPHALLRAAAATYPTADLKHVPADLASIWTKAGNLTTTISDEARSVVRFRSLNLHGDWPMQGKFNVIFCRNVMIYFDNAAKERLVSRFADFLLPGGFLYIGHSERVPQSLASKLTPVGPTIYQRCGS